MTSTDGEAILYGGIPILAVFHSSSAGLTRAAGQVWQNDLPYLKPVDSPEAKETIPNYYSRVDFTPAALKEKLLAKIPSADLSGDKKSWLKDPIRDSAGSVETVEVGGVTVRGGTVRAALGLRSACFEWELQDGNFAFYVTGYGHGVGLSQYGAGRHGGERRGLSDHPDPLLYRCDGGGLQRAESRTLQDRSKCGKMFY